MSVADQVRVDAEPGAPQGLSPNVAFGLCAGILAVLIASVLLVGKGTFLDKDPVPLRKPLDLMDKSQLGPYQIVDAVILPDEIVEALGTREYIQWVVQDTRRAANDPLRHGMLFVTYYTGGRTNVPHTPERCHLGANWATKGGWEMSLTIPGLDDQAKPVTVPTRVLVFNKAGQFDMQEQTVVYTFYANCGFACSTNEIRFWLNRPGVQKAFFSKVEVTFAGSSMGINKPDPEKAAEAARELMETVLPVLVRDHWPREQELQ